ncbi:DNA-binding transcriptional LysR family regulator [Silvimonas terrae]|uniref:DNA-binding transcriptional LysR family regulator n=1 Tax=Silvimonas terrae TaxID=300266 RepID=A0A840RLR3_9NEIS|nr:LysR family transcriptional regulator [Silvimonas terrae]MBB5193216.1 DNA-binding transcriptional LysR family regulator [Silvimonas terrae]
MVRFEDLQVFVRAAETGSFSAAARELDLTPAVASAALKRLEATLQSRLFVRSTRSLRLTSDGERYLTHARSALDALASGREAIHQDKQRISGTLSISMPSDLGRSALLGWLDVFQQQHPAVNLQIRISDRLADLYRQPVDIALRYGLLDDSSLVALPLVPDNRRIVVAAPDYLARYGLPQSPAQLRQHNCLRFVLGEVTHERWRFAQGEADHTVNVHGNRVSDDGEIVRRWVLAGNGIAYKSTLDVLPDLRAGRLVPLLPQYETEAAPFYLICAHRLQLSPTVTALREHLQDCFKHYLAPANPRQGWV